MKTKKNSKINSKHIMKTLSNVVKECSDCSKEDETIVRLMKELDENEENTKTAQRLHDIIQKIVRKECINFFNSKGKDINFYINNSVKYYLKKNIHSMNVNFKK